VINFAAFSVHAVKFVSLLIVASLAGIGCSTTRASAPASSSVSGAQLYRGCVNCHEPAGQGRPGDGVPRIAGMPAWYLVSQLQRFQDGLRGKHPDDTDGLRMRPMAQQMMSPAEIAAVAEYIAAMPKVTNTASHTGDAAAGQAIFVRCMACHGPKGEGNQQLNAPPLAGLDDWYVERQLRKFRAGVRGKAAGDAIGPAMQAMSMTLQPGEIATIAAYVHSLPR
jgi:cytochrome c oxidase subunit 2